MFKVYIIGIGPGSQDYLLPIAKREIEQADCLIGAPRALSLFQNLNKEKIEMSVHSMDISHTNCSNSTVCCHYNSEKAIAYIKENMLKKKIAVLVSGDPGLYSFMHKLSKILKKEEYEVIPGISSLQLGFARIGESWHDAKIISLHGRKANNMAEEVKANPKVFLLVDSSFPADKIAGKLLSEGVDNRRAVVLENLSYPDERVVDTNLKDLSNMKGFSLCALIILKNSTESA